MKWIVNGANSFSGKAFLRMLVDKGHHAIGFYRHSHDINLPSHRFGIEEALKSFDPDYVVNFAALNMVHESWKHYQDYYTTNVVSTSWFARAVTRHCNVKRFIQVSTPEVYGSSATGVPLHEETFFNPSTPYAVSRAAADMDMMAMYNAFGFPVSFTRSVNVYGEGQQPYRIIPKTVLKIRRGEKLNLEGGGVSTRSFIHIDDVADGIIKVAERGAAGETYHFATPYQTKIFDLVKSICYLTGAKFEDAVAMAPERIGKDMNYQLNWSKSFRHLGWEPRIQILDRLPAVVKWFTERSQQYQSLEYAHGH